MTARGGLMASHNSLDALNDARQTSIDLQRVQTVREVDDEGMLVIARKSSLHPHHTISGAWKMNPIGRTRSPRIIDRNQSSGQSCGKVMIRRSSGSYWGLGRLQDWFHSLIYLATWKVMMIASFVLLSSWVVFALLFMTVSKNCGLQANNFLRAFYLALETIETIGYGVPDPYFNDCKSGILVMVPAAIWESLLNAALIAVVYTRLSRPQGRAQCVRFSDKAIVAEVEGNMYLMTQVVDVRNHQLVESHVRMYCVEHSESERGVVCQTRHMRLQHPDDDLGGMLMMMLPQLIVHRVDQWSPLWPGPPRQKGASPAVAYAFPDIVQRQADVDNGNRDGRGAAAQSLPTLETVADRFQKGQLEIIIMIEGIEPTTAMTFQARQSYTCDDVVFNAAFQRCVHRAADGYCEVNLDAFQELVASHPDQPLVVQGVA